MASRRGKEGEVIDYLSLGSKITAEGDCSHEIKRRLLLGRKTMTNLAQRHHCADKDPYSQSYDFSSSHVWMWEFDHRGGWEPKNWYFGIVVLQMTLETARRSNQSILKEINPEHTLEGQLVKLKLQYFGHLMRRAHSFPWCWERLSAIGEVGGRGWDG